jgi:uncharacterized protein YjbI with pentapeptide repeats
MTGRLLRLGGTVLVVALGLVTPVLATSAPSPASADTVIDGCTIVSNPTPTNYTDCPNADLAGADLASVDLSYANLAGAEFVTCAYTIFPAATCTDANLASANLTQANLSSTTFSLVMTTEAGVVSGAADLSDATLTGADLSQASAFLNDMTGATAGGANLTDANLGGADLTNVDLTDANLTGTVFSGPEPPAGSLSATLTGAILTGTALVPSNQKVTQTSPTGAVVTWSTPPAVPGATPGTCTPPSGSTFPVGTTTVTCQVLDNANDVATGTFQVTVVPVTQVILPANGAVVAGVSVLDATASDAAGVTSVVFEVSGGSLTNQDVATATSTIYGWLAQWNTTTVTNGSYTLQSVATDADNNTATSTPITVTVNNPPPTTSVLIPSNGTSVSGASSLLDAATSPNVSTVTYELSDGTISDMVIASGTLTYYGWLAQWNTTTVPNGAYSLVSVAAYPDGVSTASAPISITVNNPPPTTSVLIPSKGATLSGTSATLDASASNAASVEFLLFGGSFGYSGPVVCTATLTPYGWLCAWNTTAVPNSTYTLVSEASGSGGSTFSSGVGITVNN